MVRRERRRTKQAGTTRSAALRTPDRWEPSRPKVRARHPAPPILKATLARPVKMDPRRSRPLEILPPHPRRMPRERKMVLTLTAVACRTTGEARAPPTILLAAQ